jgi:UDP-4-amino-4,6-dideoxy-N-acetyl-beta-L-altrosamine transaminase
MKIIPYGRHHVTEEDIQAVTEVLRSDFLTQGPKVAELESAFAAYVGANYAVALSSGTAALHLAALALSVNEKSNVICTPITFAASSNCIRYAGGNVYFADIDPETYVLDLEKVRELILSKPRGFFQGIIPVNFAGFVLDMEKFRALADEFGLWIIEDACHAPGGHFVDSSGNRQLCGNAKFSDIAIFSFHPVKHIATGEGGMITTNSDQLYQHILTLRTHGIVRRSELYSNPIELATGGFADDKYPDWYQEMQELGYNYRLTDFQAALGLSQMKRADKNLERRREIAARYDTAFEGTKNILSGRRVTEGHAFHLYVIQAEDRLGLFKHLREKNIYAQIHYVPVHLMPYYRDLGWKLGDFPNAENYYRHCISLPMYPTMTDDDIDFVIKSVKEFQ